MSFGWWTGRVFSQWNTTQNKRKQMTHINIIVDEFQKHYAMWKKPHTKDCILSDFIYVKIFFNAKTIISERRSELAIFREVRIKGEWTFWDGRNEQSKESTQEALIVFTKLEGEYINVRYIIFHFFLSVQD